MHLISRARRRAAVLAAGLAAAGLAMSLAAGSAQAQIPIPTGVPMELEFKHSGKVANVAGAHTTKGTPLIQWPDVFGGYANGQFKFVEAARTHWGPNRYFIQPVHALNMYVSASGSIFGPPGDAVELWQAGAGTPSLWRAVPVPGKSPYVHLINEKTNRALNVAGGVLSNGAPLITWPKQFAYENDHILIRPAD